MLTDLARRFFNFVFCPKARGASEGEFELERARASTNYAQSRSVNMVTVLRAIQSPVAHLEEP